MAIDAIQRKAITAGQALTAKYKGTQYTVEVIAGEGGKLLYRLGDGREFKSPSSAGSAVMSGSTCNGWRFWAFQCEATSSPMTAATRAVQPHTAPPAKATVMGAQDAAPAKAEPEWEHEDDEARQIAKAARQAPPKARPVCARCSKGYISAAALAHHEANADRLCRPAA